MDVSLTSDADYMLCTLYSEYKSRLARSVPKDDAVLFGGSEMLQELIPEWPTHDITATSRELAESGFLSAVFGDNSLEDCALTKDALVYMEGRFRGNVSALLDTIGKLRSIVFP